MSDIAPAEKRLTLRDHFTLVSAIDGQDKQNGAWGTVVQRGDRTGVFRIQHTTHIGRRNEVIVNTYALPDGKRQESDKEQYEDLQEFLRVCRERGVDGVTEVETDG